MPKLAAFPKAYLDDLRGQVGLVDFADLVYLRSELYVREQRRQDGGYEPPVPPLLLLLLALDPQPAAAAVTAAIASSGSISIISASTSR